MLNTPGMVNQGSNRQALENALVGDLNAYEDTMQQNIRPPLINDMNAFGSRSSQHSQFQNNQSVYRETQNEPQFILDENSGQMGQSRGQSTYYPPQGRTTTN